MCTAPSQLAISNVGNSKNQKNILTFSLSSLTQMLITSSGGPGPLPMQPRSTKDQSKKSIFQNFNLCNKQQVFQHINFYSEEDAACRNSSHRSFVAVIKTYPVCSCLSWVQSAPERARDLPKILQSCSVKHPGLSTGEAFFLL